MQLLQPLKHAQAQELLLTQSRPKLHTRPDMDTLSLKAFAQALATPGTGCTQCKSAWPRHMAASAASARPASS